MGRTEDRAGEAGSIWVGRASTQSGITDVTYRSHALEGTAGSFDPHSLVYISMGSTLKTN